MTIIKISTVVIAAIVLLTSYCVSAQAPGPAPMVTFGPSVPAPTGDCLNSLLNMSDCLSYVTAGSNVTTPDKACCPELAGMVDSQPICLCQLFGNTTESFGIKIDMNRALKLPSVCGVSTPPVSACAAVGVPIPSEVSLSPAQAPGPAPTVAFGPSVPAPTDDCLNSLLNMSDCLSYVTAGSNDTAPDKACCPELAGLVDSQPICLCQLFGNTTESFGIKIDTNRALKLPSVCGVSTPPVSACAAVGVPIPSGISLSPGAQPPGVAASPTAGDNINGASNITGSSLAFLIGLAIAFVSTFF